MSQDSPYPEAIITDVLLPDVQQYVDTYDADHMNAVRAAIRDITATLGINPQGSLATLVARLAVSLAADGKLIFPQQTVFVAKSGGHFTTIQAAINSITDAASNKQYTIIICPGTYNETITAKSYVHLVGTSKLACILSTSNSTRGLAAASDMTISNLHIEKTGNEGAYALKVEGISNFKAFNCVLKALTEEDMGLKMLGGSAQLDLCDFFTANHTCIDFSDDDAQTFNLKLTRCYINSLSSYCLDIYDYASSQNAVSLYDCTLVTGQTKSINYTHSGSGATAFRSAHNRMNAAFDVDLTDLITTPYNVIDSDIT